MKSTKEPVSAAPAPIVVLLLWNLNEIESDPMLLLPSASSAKRRITPPISTKTSLPDCRNPGGSVTVPDRRSVSELL